MTEVEYIVTMYATKEAIWLCSFFAQIFKPIVEPTTIFCDNQSAIALAKHSHHHTCTKHINIHFHFIHWSVVNNIVTLEYCPTNDMVADTLMKALPLLNAKHFAIAF